VDVPEEFSSRKFLNQVVMVETSLDVWDFSEKIHSIEDILGRVRGPVRNTPRTIDIDLVDFGGMVSDDPELTLPHPRARMRDFVMGPLAELGLADCLGCSGDSGAANAPGKGR
jgi:2-amino-4-hydroxy-6-hydroxymethyldihydropteridine diphosphokinase